ncbi:MAG: DUF5678 domain-containing protein [Chloroflexota bacterium]|nr:DUF5678 domain-containing protein [Chloroflexota bacterium]
MSSEAEPRTQDDDLDWVTANMYALADHGGRWIAVQRRAVVASGATAAEVIDQLRKLRFDDALVTQIPAERNLPTYVIA